MKLTVDWHRSHPAQEVRHQVPKTRVLETLDETMLLPALTNCFGTFLPGQQGLRFMVKDLEFGVQGLGEQSAP